MVKVKYSGLLLVPLIKRVHAASGTGVLGHCRVKSPNSYGKLGLEKVGNEGVGATHHFSVPSLLLTKPLRPCV